MTIFQFIKEFDTEEKCRNYIEKIRWPDGIISGFNSLLDRLSELNRQHDAQISKLEDLI